MENEAVETAKMLIAIVQEAHRGNTAPLCALRDALNAQGEFSAVRTALSERLLVTQIDGGLILSDADYVGRMEAMERFIRIIR